jgi:hypothetical protein
MADAEFKLGEHDAHIAQLIFEMRELRREVHSLQTTMSQARGGWKVVVALGTVAGAFGAYLLKLVSTLQSAASPTP